MASSFVICSTLIPRFRPVSSRTLRLNRSRALGAMRRFDCLPPLWPNRLCRNPKSDFPVE